MEYAALTHVGLKRQLNEDSYGFTDPKAGLPVSFVLADGLGGYEHGEVASALTVEYCLERLRQLPEDMTEEQMQAELMDIIQKINVRVYLESLQDQRLTGMCSTVNLAVFFADVMYSTHIGDSRTYLLRAGELKALTIDHTLVHQLMAEGGLTPEEVKAHPDGKALVQAIGGYLTYLKPDFSAIPTMYGDRFLLCSDGLHGEVDDEVICRLLQEAPTPQKACDDLMQAALEAGGKDNITVICIFNDNEEVNL